jgi:hypothetical protein
MQLFSLTAVFSLAAMPQLLAATPLAGLCPNTLFSIPLCCAFDVAGHISDCQVPATTPTNTEEFQSICAQVGLTAACCTVVILGQPAVCSSPN